MDFQTGEETQENCVEPDAEDVQKRQASRLEGDRSLPGSRSWSKLSCQTVDQAQQTDDLDSGLQNSFCEKETGKEEKEETEKETKTEDEPDVDNETELNKTDLVKAGQDKTALDKTEVDKTEEDDTELNENQQDQTELNNTDLHPTELDKERLIELETQVEIVNEIDKGEEKEESEYEESENEESGNEGKDEETADEGCEEDGEENIEKEIEHFPKIHNGLESDTFSEISLHVPRVTIADRIRQLSSESQLSLKAWQNADKMKLRGTINATRSHPNCFSQNHLENITSSRAVGRFKQGETIPSAGVRTVIFWSNEREKSNDAADEGKRSHLWASSMSMHSKQGVPIRNLRSVHSCFDRKADRPQSHEFCPCNRFVDHHNAYFQTLQQKARTASFPGFHIFQTELDEDDDVSFPRNPNLSPKFEVGFFPKRNNTPVVPIRQHRTNFSPKQSYKSFSGYNFPRGYPLTSRSRDSFSFRSPSWETSTYSPIHVSPRHPPIPNIFSTKSRKPPSKPMDKDFNDMIRGTGSFVSNESV